MCARVVAVVQVLQVLISGLKIDPSRSHWKPRAGDARG